jgi:hypothetical protein
LETPQLNEFSIKEENEASFLKRLNIYQKEEFKEISEILLTTIMGATIIHELIGPVSAKSALKKAGEIKTE